MMITDIILDKIESCLFYQSTSSLPNFLFHTMELQPASALKPFQFWGYYHMRRIMINLLLAYAQKKAQISCAVTAQLISAFVFAK